MCLDVVTSTEHDPKATGIGYKIMKPQPQPDGTWIGEWYGKHPLPENQELTAETNLIERNRPQDGIPRKLDYNPGFHIYESLHGARRELFWSMVLTEVVKVKWRHKLAQGTEDDHNVIVAKFITILGKVSSLSTSE